MKNYSMSFQCNPSFFPFVAVGIQFAGMTVGWNGGTYLLTTNCLTCSKASS